MAIKTCTSISKLFHVETKLTPSFHMATKHRCKLITWEVDYLSKFKFLLPKSNDNDITRSNDAIDYEGKKNKVKNKHFAKIKGECEKVHTLLADNLECRFKDVNVNSVIMFDNFDGGNHLETAEGKIDLVGFSSALANANLLSSRNYSAAWSSSILTFMQLAEKEESCMLLSVLKSHCKSRIKLKEKLKKRWN